MKRIKATHSFGPVVDENSKILILGSFPSAKSIEKSFYYGHPQNRFWKVLGVLFNEPNLHDFSVNEKRAWLLDNRIALYDSIESCTIEGSSDNKIEDVVPADLESLIFSKADIKRVYINGATAFRYFEMYNPSKIGLATKLPSTSPANAAWSLERLLSAWSIIKE